MVCHTKTGSQNYDGYTLIELLVVLVIVSLLLTIVAPRYIHRIDDAKKVVNEQNLAVMRDAIDKFYSDKGFYPQRLEDLVEQRYLKAIPANSINDSKESWVPIMSDDINDPGIIDVGSTDSSTKGQ